MALRRVLEWIRTHTEDHMATTRRKITSAEEAHRLLDELAASGEDATAFCRQAGIDGRSLNCWRLNLRRRKVDAGDGGTGPLRLVEVGWPEPGAAVGVSGSRACGESGRYRVEVADAVVEVDDSFRDETLARLLAVVRAC